MAQGMEGKLGPRTWAATPSATRALTMGSFIGQPGVGENTPKLVRQVPHLPGFFDGTARFSEQRLRVFLLIPSVEPPEQWFGEWDRSLTTILLKEDY